MLRLLILGSNSGLGRALARELAPQFHIIAWTRAELDLAKADDIEKRLAEQEFDVLLNPAGVTSPDVCAEKPELAAQINAEAPKHLAAACARKNARFVHFSTDYVFSGEGQETWSEADLTSPANFYGQTKRAGEIAALENNPRTLIARVSWLFGPDKPSHPDHIIAKALQSGEISAVSDKTSAPTFTHDIAAWIACLLTHHADISGPLHLCNSGNTSWHGWAQAALEIAQSLGVPVQTTQVTPTPLSSLTFFKATRPPHTTLDNARLAQITGSAPRHWRVALEDYLTQKFAAK